MHLARLAGLDDQAGLHAQALADQVMMHRRGGQQRRDRNAVGATPRGPTGSGCCCRPAPRRSPRGRCARARVRKPGRAFAGAARCMSIVAVRKAPSSSSAIERIFSRSALVRTGCDDFQPLVRAGVAAEQVGARPDHRDQRHHQLLADRIDRRVGDLGEVLLEIVVEQLGLLREHRDRRVGAHRADRIVAGCSPSARGRTAGLPGCSRRPAGDRAAATGSLAAARWSSGRSGRSSSLNWVGFSHSS